MRSLTRDEVREIDRRAIEELGLPGVVLMENAGRGCAELMLRQGVGGRVVVCCGRGNNGGDGYVIARHLENAGTRVDVLLFAEAASIRGDAAINLRVLQAAATPLHVVGEAPDRAALEEHLRDADWVVDALLGTGARGTVREPLVTAITAINGSGARVLAVDLPSGLDCDTGRPLAAASPSGGAPAPGPHPTCVRAERTATFVAPKRGFDNPDAAEFTGEVHVIDIGVPRSLLTSWDSREKFEGEPARPAT